MASTIDLFKDVSHILLEDLPTCDFLSILRQVASHLVLVYARYYFVRYFTFSFFSLSLGGLNLSSASLPPWLVNITILDECSRT